MSTLPGRLERRPGEMRDGAHTPDAVDWLRERLPARDYTICASILADKDVEGILRRLESLGNRFVATASSECPLAPRDRARRPRSASLCGASRRSPIPPPRSAARTSSVSRFW